MTKSNKWSDKEVEIITKYYPLGGSNLCLEKGLNRSASNIRQKATAMGLKTNKYWSDAELNILKNYYPIGGYKLCQQKGLNRGGSPNKGSSR